MLPWPVREARSVRAAKRLTDGVVVDRLTYSLLSKTGLP